MSTYRTDVDAVAQAYVRNNVNGAINPYRSDWAPGYVNMGLVGWISQDPNPAHPSWNGELSTNGNTMMTNQVRQAMIDLGVYYAWIAKGHYGLQTSNQSGAQPLQYEGYGYFVFNSAAPGAGDHSNRVYSDLQTAGTMNGTIQYAQLTNFYQFCWNIIWNRKDDLLVDLTVCHSSCHSSCHGSRGRR